MPGRTRYVPQNIRWFNRILRTTYGLWLHAFFRVEGKNVNLAKALKPPFVIVSNHVSVLDPFILGSFLREPVYWITSDGNMRSRLMRALLTLVGSIPKSKSIPDIETVNWTVEVIRRRGGVVGIFPEGQQSWDGTTLPLVPSTAKLLKLLKVPVLAAVIKGGYSSLPRWTGARRRGRMEVEFKLLFGPEELKALGPRRYARGSSGPLPRRDGLAGEGARSLHGAAQGGARRAGPIHVPSLRGRRIAPELALPPQLPVLRDGPQARCVRALQVRKGDAPGLREHPGLGPMAAEAFERLVSRRRGRGTRGGRDSSRIAGALILRGRKMNPLRRLRSGTLILYPDRIELATLLGERLRFPLADIEGISVLKRTCSSSTSVRTCTRRVSPWARPRLAKMAGGGGDTSPRPGNRDMRVK